MKRITLLAFLILPVISFAQIDFGTPIAATLGGAVTASAKNWEAIGIDPANLGYDDNHTFSFSVANVDLNLQDQGITAKELENTYNQFISGSGNTTFTPANQQNLYNAVTAPGGFNMSTSINWFSLSFHIKNIGGFGISLTDVAYAHVFLTANAASVLFQGANSPVYTSGAAPTTLVSTYFAGTNAGVTNYRELNLDYGVKILTIKTHGGEGGASFQNSEYINPNYKTSDTVSNPIRIFAGVGFKPIWGLSSYNSQITSGENIEQGTLIYIDPNYFQSPTSKIFNANGRGSGLDLGLSATWKKWRIGFSVIDLGSVYWQNPEFTSSGKYLPTLTGADSGGIDGNTSNKSSGGIVNQLITYSPEGITGQQNYTTQLPSKFRAGISYDLIPKFISLNGDFVSPLNTAEGNLIHPYYSAGVNFNLFRIIGLGVGFAAEQGSVNVVPVGAFINVLSGFEIYAGTTDALAFLGSANGHILSASVGVKIFGF